MHTLIFRQFFLSFNRIIRESRAIFKVAFLGAVIAGGGIVKDLSGQQIRGLNSKLAGPERIQMLSITQAEGLFFMLVVALARIVEIYGHDIFV